MSFIAKSVVIPSAVIARLWMHAALMFVMVALMTGCEVDDRCDQEYVYMRGACYPKPTPPPPDSGASDDASSDAGGETKDTFGKSCAGDGDCAGGNAPICAPAPFSVCTQQNCAAGEAHAGVCPSDWMCLAIPGMPSVCADL